ncbi:2025_t:CDS:2, partial [Cetraspora pellucida]
LLPTATSDWLAFMEPKQVKTLRDAYSGKSGLQGGLNGAITDDLGYGPVL